MAKKLIKTVVKTTEKSTSIEELQKNFSEYQKLLDTFDEYVQNLTYSEYSGEFDDDYGPNPDGIKKMTKAEFTRYYKNLRTLYKYLLEFIKKGSIDGTKVALAAKGKMDEADGGDISADPKVKAVSGAFAAMLWVNGMQKKFSVEVTAAAASDVINDIVKLLPKQIKSKVQISYTKK